MSLTHLIIVIKSEASLFPVAVIFFAGCMPDCGCTIICPWFHLYPGIVGFSPFVIVQSYDVRT